MKQNTLQSHALKFLYLHYVTCCGWASRSNKIVWKGAFIVLWVIRIDVCCLLFVVNVDEWLKSANSLSPNDMEAGEIFVFNIIYIVLI